MPEKLTVLLVVILVPTDVLRGADDLSLFRPSPLSSLWRAQSYEVWFNVDFETAQHCKNITKANQGCGSASGRTGADRMISTVAGGKENKRPRSTAGEVKSPLPIQLDRGTQRSLYVWIFFREDGDDDFVKYPSKDVLSCPVACH